MNHFNLPEFLDLPFLAEISKVLDILEVFAQPFELLKIALSIHTSEYKQLLTSSRINLSSSVNVLVPAFAVQGSRCSLFSNGAPRLTSRFKLQDVVRPAISAKLRCTSNAVYLAALRFCTTKSITPAPVSVPALSLRRR